MAINRPAVSKIVSAALIKAKKWLWVFVPWALLELLKHRFLSWANEQIDRMAAVMEPYMTPAFLAVVASLTAWATGHPFELFISFVGIYSIAIVTHTWRSLTIQDGAGNGPTDRNAADTGLSGTLTLPSLDGVGIHVWFFHQQQTEIDGLLISAINDSTKVLKDCKMTVSRERSFDSKQATFVDDLQSRVVLPSFGNIPHKDESKGTWLIRVANDKTHLEIGDSHGQGMLRWPPREPIQNRQVWLLEVALEASGITPREFNFRFEWSLPSTIKVRLP